MLTRLSFVLAIMAFVPHAAAQTTPSAGMVITQSGPIAAGEHRVDSADLNAPAIVIRGDDLVVDFAGATLVGTDDPTRPDQFTGVAVVVEGDNVTIKNLAARGYKVGLLARGATGLTLQDCNLSYNYRQRLKSTPWQEDVGDWMSYHNNENGEWLRFGAAVYLDDCDGFTITGLEVTGGQNGVMMTNCDNGVIHSSRITFNSAIGIGMYRSTGNRIMHNRLDFNVRGHSEGVYNRGQDSAAILMYEQTSNNIIAWNSATHSGDGLFLWAGQSTMDTGAGGSNDNLIYENDFSFAPTNGIEVTFSRNQIVGNKLHGCWHGIWGGYSYETIILANDFADNEDGISIEHGQGNSIGYNRFTGDETAIHLFERGVQEGWGYGENRETDSRGYTIFFNDFVNVETALLARDTTSMRGFGNTFENVETEFDIEGAEFEKVMPQLAEGATREGRLAEFRPEPIEGAKLPPPLVATPSGRVAIRITEWGPYDYRSPRFWPEVAKDSSGATLTILGLDDTFEFSADMLFLESAIRGVASGEGVKFVLPPSDAAVSDQNIAFDYSSESDFVDEFGQIIPAGQKVTVAYSRFVAPIAWNVSFYEWDDASDPRTEPEAFAKVIAGEPIATVEVDSLDFRGQRPWAEGVPTTQFAAVAEGKLAAPAGEYVLNITSDDGVRVWLDGEVIFEDWTHHAPYTEAIPVTLDGEHTLRIEHFQIDGYAQLRADLQRS